MDHITKGFKKCPACNGEGYINVTSAESGQPGTEGHLMLLDADECEVCEGTGEVPVEANS